MARWDLYCDNCGKEFIDVDVRGDVPACGCGDKLKKNYSRMRIVIKGDIPPHYNESLGMYVKSRADLKEKLWLTNSRTEDIDPSGGLTREERQIIEDKRTALEKRKTELFWGMNPASPEDGTYAE